MSKIIEQSTIAAHNEPQLANLRADYQYLGEQLRRRGIDIDAIKAKAAAFAVALPSWGVGTGGTRFARFAGIGEPRNVFDKVQDCGVIHQLVGITPTVSPHLPWDKTTDYAELREYAGSFGLNFDCVNSNTFQDQKGQAHSYKFGSLTHADAATRQQAVEHNIECIEIGKALGAKALTVWVGDGSNFPGQQHFGRSFERYIESNRKIYAALPSDWQMFLEHKMFEPAFYSTVLQDWGSSYIAATALGEKAKCLVDLGHHAPNVNIEMIVTRLAATGKLAGFHFNDSKYGDDDLDSGSINPYQLFLIFNELVDAEARKLPNFKPEYMLDQSHNVTDPIESLMNSATEVQRAYVQALLIDRAALEGFQDGCDALQATRTLKQAYTTDVTPILALARAEAGAAVDPVGAYRASGYRARVGAERPAVASSGGGIV
ncbi:L-rhamnose catabolism isomerase [Duganella sp. FT80W]|uniref:L-rhamnose catabolism isomerase n=1 Tax=Duganella guangzhouensis TaxID=2666084 RepID=A0A6I2L5Z2_9BURK|nr:L-rhamnose catabolism isomerase [Duganella guangzhouensis]MRW92076.1 L-rhamnose catabolism isomerase [Duganella guangzhouensis]